MRLRGIEKRWIHILVLGLLGVHFLLFALAACSGIQTGSPEGEIKAKIAVGQKIPDLKFRDAQGGPVSLSSLLEKADKTALVFYRGYWCSYCQEQFVSLRANLSDFQDQKAQIIGVSADDPYLLTEFGRNVENQYRVETKRSPNAQGLNPAIVLLSDNTREAIPKLGIGDNHSRFGLVARPTTVLLDKGGTVRWLYVGKSPDDRPTPDKILQALTWYF
jgi:peroxiredoxin